MNVDGIPHRSIWFEDDTATLRIIDQTRLPHEFVIAALHTLDDACHAIGSMQVRGAPLIGVTAAFGLYLALRTGSGSAVMMDAAARLAATRPTAVNLRWALNRVMTAIAAHPEQDEATVALATARVLCAEDVATCSRIGDHGLPLIDALWQKKQKQGVVNILTHCNAGWLAAVDWGTALAPVYKAVAAGIPVHVWVDETRPRNQGASLTAWELARQQIPHTVISDNAGGHLMQAGRVDLCLVGSDRTTRQGAVCNKIGTYLKALAAWDNQVPFYVALPLSTIDWEADSIPIEERDADEVTHIQGLNSQGRMDRVRLTPAGSPALNHAFDITPGRLVTGLITENGIFNASAEGLARLKQTDS
ncbi:MAG: S-methyl-5-thioribose-1-phosphate isomerase [Pseudomonadales bacterium]|nr:S-methyl-5-thioribose-1-phosphate isomerase [Pseudomonadales bacterium]